MLSPLAQLKDFKSLPTFFPPTKLKEGAKVEKGPQRLVDPTSRFTYEETDSLSDHRVWVPHPRGWKRCVCSRGHVC